MMDFVLATVPFVMKIVVGIWLFVAVAMVLLVLIQKGRGGGLSSAFGGISNSLLGTKTGDFLTWVTISLVAVWLVLSVVAAKWFKPQTSEYLQGQKPAAPVSAPAMPVDTDQLLQTEQQAQSQQSENSQIPESNTPASAK
ncbi:MAG: preprotein translocase subunit SecG [Phycisphaerae bacterium]|jgi:preprotein translocase subunit SecG